MQIFFPAFISFKSSRGQNYNNKTQVIIYQIPERLHPVMELNEGPALLCVPEEMSAEYIKPDYAP